MIKAPVLLFVFSRPDTLKKVFDAVKISKPEVLFLVSDGPRMSIPGEKLKVETSRKIVENIDWDCEVHRLYEVDNKGLYYMMWRAMDYVFNLYDRCIFLEDDVVPSQSFFTFQNIMLEKYKYDERIQQVTGMNFLGNYPKEAETSYFFSSEPSIWGFGFWRRIYKSFDREHSYGTNIILMQNLKKCMPKNRFNNVINYVKQGYSNGHIAGLEYFFGLDKYINNRLSIVPNKNMISNIGCVNESQHENTYITMPKSVQKMYYMEIHEYNISQNDNVYVINDRYYSTQATKITGTGHPYRLFARRIITFFKLIRYEGISGLIFKLKKRIRNRNES